ncbi:hypothetical protein E2C01_072047 [Portunus trituberculatus]|uniref:Uncharacterized protein n=1 Tax=Portunus trituberculatus TaxID=210409 RepID=A0A5B7HWZ4_PORTR|nr:hypothetical protein [Portunus trituberculatus]
MKPHYCPEVGFTRPHSTPAEVLKQARLSGKSVNVHASPVEPAVFFSIVIVHQLPNANLTRLTGERNSHKGDEKNWQR